MSRGRSQMDASRNNRGWGRSMMMLGGLVFLGTTLGGCATTVAQKDYDSVLSENTELRERNAALESAADRYQQRVAGIQQQNDQLEAEISKLRTSLTASPAASQTGFENIRGVGVSKTESGEIVLAIAGDVLFDSGSVVLKKQSRETLARVASVLKSQYGSNVVRIEGHTDTDPIKKSKWKTNERLSFERANAVEQYLAQQGVNNKRMYSAAFGPAKPKNSKNKSRRVEIVILAEGA